MQFSDTAAKLGLIQACERYCNLGDAGISGSSSLLKEFTAHINQHGRKVWHYIFEVYGGWQYDDANQTDLPAGVGTLTASQTSYALPSSALTVRGVEVKDTGGGWTPLLPLTEEQIRDSIAMGQFMSTTSNPRYYQLVGQSIRIFPASNYTQASSFKVFFDRGSVAFASTNTTETPGFASEYHDVLAIGASMEWLKTRVPESATLRILQADYLEYINNLKNFYSQRFLQMVPKRFTTKDLISDYI